MFVSKPVPDLPILVGVTGHRDILPASLRDVQNAVRAALAALRAALGPNLMLMTALAEGADQLVADIARELGIRMIAISPMPLELYRRTMDTAEGAVALERLWKDGLVVQRPRTCLWSGPATSRSRTPRSMNSSASCCLGKATSCLRCGTAMTRNPVRAGPGRSGARAAAPPMSSPCGRWASAGR